MKVYIIAIFSCIVTIPTAFSQTIDSEVQSFARYPAGIDNFYEYIRSTVKYPEDAKRDSITGEVHVEFVVGKDGSIINESIKVVKGLSVSCDAEAVRIIRMSPRWEAAKTRREAIEQKITFPVTFVYK
jgi:protein TonB